MDYGKYEETKVETDKFMFYVPLLRNVEKTGPYLHDGSVSDLAEVVKIMGKAELNKEISDKDAADMVAFMKTLTGDVPQDAASIPEELK